MNLNEQIKQLENVRKDGANKVFSKVIDLTGSIVPGSHYS